MLSRGRRHEAAAQSRKKRRASCATLMNLKFFRECGLFAELGDLVRQPRHFAARGIPMHLALVRRAHQRWLRKLHRVHCLVAVTGGDRFLDLAERAAHARAARLVDLGAARDFAGGFACG